MSETAELIKRIEMAIEGSPPYHYMMLMKDPVPAYALSVADVRALIAMICQRAECIAAREKK